jgi:tetratricopeptide (TPR) repeat protein
MAPITKRGGVGGAFEQAGKWEQLADVLRARAEQSARAEAKRADLARLAQVLSSQLENPQAATEVWQEVERRFGDDAVSAQALIELFGVQERWQEAADRLESASTEQRAELVSLYVQWAEVLSRHLKQPQSAARVYALALALQPSHSRAQEALQAIVSNEEAPAETIEALARAYEETGDTQALVALTDLRLSRMTTPVAEARLLADVADQAERLNRDADTARTLLAKALKRAPNDARLEADLLRLCTDASSWRLAAETLAEAASALADENPRKAHLHVQRARLLETRLAQPEAALPAYEAALRLAPERNDLKLALVRLTAARGEWVSSAEAVLRAPVSTEIVKGQLLPAFEAAIQQSESAEAWASAANALAQVLAKRAGLPEALARDLELTVATWAEVNVKGPEGRKLAEAALLRATRQNPLHVSTWERLARLQRQEPGRALLETLQHLATLTADNLDAASEALKVAAGIPDSAALLRNGWATLSQISHLLRTDTSATGAVDVATAADQAVAAVSSVLLATGHKQDAGRAVNMMMEVAHWNLPPHLLRGLRRKAARITLEVLGDKTRARTLYRPSSMMHPRIARRSACLQLC